MKIPFFVTLQSGLKQRDGGDNLWALYLVLEDQDSTWNSSHLSVLCIPVRQRRRKETDPQLRVCLFSSAPDRATEERSDAFRHHRDSGRSQTSEQKGGIFGPGGQLLS